MSARIVLAAGGTGGHVFPAQALARELKGRGRSLVLMTDRRGTGYGDALDGLETVAVRAATPIGKHGLARLGALLDTVIGTFQARAALTRLRPAAVVGFGGYPALPTLLAAVRAGVPTLIHEQNAVLGRVNRLLAPLVGAIALSVGETLGLRARDWGKTRVVGNPVREAVVRLRAVPYEPPTEGGPVRLLVFGGSQGAAVLARLVPAAMGLLPAALRSRFAIVQQCRAEDRAATAARYRECGTAAELAPFFADLPERMAAAHLVIARAGASTVSELAVIGRPAVLVPLPQAADDHQTANAQALAAAGAAWIEPQSTLTAGRLAERLTTLLAAPATLAAAARHARALGRPEAAGALADLVEGMAGAPR